jgi:hypothetical protein
MLKTFSKYAHVALALSLTLTLAASPVDARPSGSSSSSSSSKSSFGSFSRKSAAKAPHSGGAPTKARGGFGSFGSAPASDSHRSDSALSRKLDKESSEANALRTLDERRAAQAARNAPPSASNDGQPAGSYQDNARTPPPQGYPAQPPIIIRQDSGLGKVVAGAILARSAANAHANNNNNGYYPAPNGSAGDLANKAGAGSVGSSSAAAKDNGGSVLGSIVRTFLWLCLLSLIGWCVYFMWKRAKARRAANKPNYSFERN